MMPISDKQLIDELTARIISLEVTLFPFARYARHMETRWLARDDSAHYGVARDARINITYGMFRRAVKVMALAPAPATPEDDMQQPVISVAFTMPADSALAKYLAKRMVTPPDSKRNKAVRMFSMAQVCRELLEDSARRALAEERKPERYKNVKSGSVVEIIGTAQVQAAPQRRLVEGVYVVVYRHMEHGDLWVRETNEFHDGRFIRLDPEPVSKK